MNKRIPENIVRYNSPSAIQFTLITDRDSYSENDFYYWALNMLRYLPSDLMQLEDSIKHFEVSFRMNLRRTYELMSLPTSFFPDDLEASIIDFTEYSKMFNITSQLQVFLIDPEINDHQKIARFLNKMGNGYFSVFTESKEILQVYQQENFFDSDAKFIELIRRDIDLINQRIASLYSNQQLSMSIDPKLSINSTRTLISINDLPGSAIAFNNYFILNQITGNHWLENTGKDNNVKTEPDKRIEEAVAQAIKLDNISVLMYKEVGIKNTDITQPRFPSIVIIAPYHFPKPEKLYGNNLTRQKRAYLSIARTEQNLNYEHTVEENRLKEVSKKEFLAIMANVAQRLRYLDCIGYLHARFSYSPVIRLPHIGKSINLELSHISKSSSKNAISSIKKFGEKLNKLVISPALSDYLIGRSGQIFAISDLPFEWLFLNKYPISYSHDVCRLPEFNTNGLANTAIHHQRFSYEIPEDLISKTLVVHCASEQDQNMQSMFDVIDGFKTTLGFNSVRCTKVEKISHEVERLKPELLIFDCHGSTNPKDLSSYLVVDSVNKEYLTGDKIVEHKISAPLVILSACETMPNYGYVKHLSDAFMEVGAYCVTTTFLPIKMGDAATLLIRLLSKLDHLKTGIYHNNWLNFMSHVLRTSMIFETIRRARPNLEKEITDEEISLILARTMRFEERLDALAELDNLIKERSGGTIPEFTDLDNEWLSYSIVGRADLLYFSNWLNEFRRLNGANSI